MKGLTDEKLIRRCQTTGSILMLYIIAFLLLVVVIILFNKFSTPTQKHTKNIIMIFVIAIVIGLLLAVLAQLVPIALGG